jgi:uncharacterized protein YndB with AHSA1/START domain
MVEPRRRECVLILKRIVDAPIERVWRAWTDPAELGQWFVAGDDHVVHFCDVDLRIGGHFHVGFGPPGRPPFVEKNRYTEIVRPTRLAYHGEMTVDGKVVMVGEGGGVDFSDLGDGRTLVVITNVGEEDIWRHGAGWIPNLNSLERFLATAMTEAHHA